MKPKPLQFAPGRIDNTHAGRVEVLPAIVMPDGSEILLHGFDRACRPSQHKRRKLNLPTLGTRNELGAQLVEAFNTRRPLNARQLAILRTALAYFRQYLDANGGKVISPELSDIEHLIPAELDQLSQLFR